MKEVLIALHQKPIAYYPIYRDITGSTTAAILLSQLLYWYSACKGKKFYKTDSEIMEETRLTEKELRNAKSCLKKFDFIIIELEGLPRRTFYSFNETNLHRLLVQSSDAQMAELETPKGRVNNRPKGIAITENTKNFAKSNSEREELALEKPKTEEVNYINAHEIARVEFLRRYLDLNPDWENKCFAEPYFENLQKKGEWFALQIPTNANDLQKWIGKHYAGINSWASNEHKFWKNKKAANPTTQQQKNGAEPTITIAGIPVPLSVYQLYQSENG